MLRFHTALLLVVVLAPSAPAQLNPLPRPVGEQREILQYESADGKKTQALQADPTRIALYQSAQNRTVDPAAQLAAHGVRVAGIENQPLDGWCLAQPAGNMKSRAELDALIAQISSVPGVDFVSPVLLDSAGDPMLVPPEFFVSFDANVSGDRAIAILRSVGDGTVTDVNYAGMSGVYRVRSAARSGVTVLALTNALAGLPSVEFAEPDFIMTCRLADFPNDPLFDACWFLDNPTGQDMFECLTPGPPNVDMGALEAWEITRGDPSIIVAVLDVGIELDHPDLNTDPSLGADFTGQGGAGNPVYASDCHGTAVAGVITARLNNHIGIAGIAPECRVASVRVVEGIDQPNQPCGDTGVVRASWQIEGLAWAEEIGARVSNCSYGTSSHSHALELKFEQTHANGMVHFAAAGNGGNRSINYPAKFAVVNALSAVDNQPALAPFSNFGPRIDFSAPGVCLASLDRVGALGFNASGPYPDYVWGLNGTSGAAPLAAGVAALILSVNPTLSADEVEAIMQQSAVDLGTPGWDPLFGWGFVNAYNAVSVTPDP